MCGGHRLHQERSGTGEERTRSRENVPQGNKEMSGPQMDSAGNVEVSPTPQKRQQLTQPHPHLVAVVFIVPFIHHHCTHLLVQSY